MDVPAYPFRVKFHRTQTRYMSDLPARDQHLSPGEAPVIHVFRRPNNTIRQASQSIWQIAWHELHKRSDMRHSGKLFRREVPRDRAHRSAWKVEGGACSNFSFDTSHVTRLKLAYAPGRSIHKCFWHVGSAYGNQCARVNLQWPHKCWVELGVSCPCLSD